MEIVQIIVSYDQESDNELFITTIQRIPELGYRHYEGYYVILIPNGAIHGILLSAAVHTANMSWETWNTLKASL